MDGLTFVILSAGEDHRIVNAILDAYDTLADSSTKDLRKVSLRRLLVNVIKEHPTLGRALSWAKSLGQSGGRIISPEVRRLISSRRYTDEDLDSINIAIDEAMSPDFIVPYQGSNYEEKKRSIISRPVGGRRDYDETPLSTSRPTQRTGWQMLVSELAPQGYSLTDIAEIWHQGPGHVVKESSLRAPESSRKVREEDSYSSEEEEKPIRKAKSTEPSKPRTFADRVEHNQAKVRKPRARKTVQSTVSSTVSSTIQTTPNSTNYPNDSQATLHQSQDEEDPHEPHEPQDPEA